MRKMILIIIALFIIGACGKNDLKGKNIEITPQEVIARLTDKSKNTFLLYLTTENCYSCEEYEKVVEQLQQEGDFKIYHINLDLLEQDQDILAALKELNITIGDYTQLPMTYYFYQGQLLPENIKVGFIEKSDYREWLKGLRLIK